MPINPKPTYVAQWNVTYQRQFKGSWLASASYLGNETDSPLDRPRKGSREYLGPGPRASIAGVTYADLFHHGQLPAQRRLLYLANPGLGKLLREHRHHG